MKSSKLILSIVAMGACLLNGCTETNPWAQFETLLNSDVKVAEIDFCALKSNEKLEDLADIIASSEPLPFSLQNPEKSEIFSTALTYVHQSESIEKCRIFFQDGKSRLDTTLEEERRNFQNLTQFERSADTKIRDIQNMIYELAADDQAARNSFINLKIMSPPDDKISQWGGALAGEELLAADVKCRNYMKSLLSEIDWVDQSTYGETTAFYAWLLVQHADPDPEFQKEILERLDPYLDNGEIAKSDYAYLSDRVAVNTGGQQLYGTQSTGQCVDDLPEMQPIADIDQLDQRRLDMNLGLHIDYLESLAKTVCAQP